MNGPIYRVSRIGDQGHPCLVPLVTSILPDSLHITWSLAQEVKYIGLDWIELVERSECPRASWR